MKAIRFFKFVKVFVVLGLILLMNGCSHQPVSKEESRQRVLEEMRIYIGKIQDPKRVEQLLVLVDALQQDLAELNRTVRKFGSDMRTLNVNYDATREDFDKMLDEYNTTRKGKQREILTSYLKMKELTTPDEWKSLAKSEEKALSKGLRRTLLDNQ
ncbi:MAG: hypothetical protein JSU72_20010 [Deltaproteobacteria bacterium]|nr:MAG: hypothetical protein JSU72_20010 [Deltaproteobacteria bacterium]